MSKSAIPHPVTVLILGVATVHIALLLSVLSLGYSPAVKQVHEGLGGILRKGQLAIEVLPPLSLVITAHFTPAILTSLSKLADVFVPCVLVGHGLGFRFAKIVALSVFFFLTWKLFAEHISTTASVARTGLEASASLANAFLTLGLLFVFESPVIPKAVQAADNIVGFAEIMVIYGFVLGSNVVDGLFAYGVVFLNRVIRFMEMLPAENGHSVSSLTVRGLFTIARFLVYPVVAYLSIYGLFFPAAENDKTDVAGNYNLQFLAPSFRRSISANRTTSYPVDKVIDAGLKPFAINSSIPLSVYFPQAGFLSVEASDVRVITHYENEDGTDSDAEPVEEIQQRYAIHYTDSAPQQSWQFEYKVVYEESTGNIVDEPQESQQLKTGEVLWLRNNIYKKFLSVNADDEGDTSGDIKRFSLSLTNKPTMENSGWMVTYDASVDGGFRLYNPNSNCHLASTLRMKPLSPEESQKIAQNKADVLKHYLDLEVEAVCNTSPTDATSRLHIVDGLPNLKVDPPTFKQRALGIPAAVLRLFALRHNYESIQGSMLPGLTGGDDSPFSFDKIRNKLPNFGLVGLLSLLYFGKLIWLQRFAKDPNNAVILKDKKQDVIIGERQQGEKFPAYHLGVGLVLAHFAIYEGLGKEIRYTPVFIVAVAYMSLLDFIKTLQVE
ncbi:hypothetical protein BJ508DRAFT_170173 [Ascobolus immersus RN42]|uniref:Uncharacterized protein n=1 Tax=Ascobolus immersus RN42 TaxID=1160509 RepID=A0A3N4HZQ8_ASCIM|nr:hypothetical protein BJ508DRAFT_170173 [Ascobolus immersus RN42]